MHSQKHTNSKTIWSVIRKITGFTTLAITLLFTLFAIVSFFQIHILSKKNKLINRNYQRIIIENKSLKDSLIIYKEKLAFYDETINSLVSITPPISPSYSPNVFPIILSNRPLRDMIISNRFFQTNAQPFVGTVTSPVNTINDTIPFKIAFSPLNALLIDPLKDVYKLSDVKNSGLELLIKLRNADDSSDFLKNLTINISCPRKNLRNKIYIFSKASPPFAGSSAPAGLNWQKVYKDIIIGPNIISLKNVNISSGEYKCEVLYYGDKLYDITFFAQ